MAYKRSSSTKRHTPDSELFIPVLLSTCAAPQPKPRQVESSRNQKKAVNLSSFFLAGKDECKTMPTRAKISAAAASRINSKLKKAQKC